ncbi:hypothetical protein [Desulfobacter sp.]|uniref:hypothetical protein n=1 Tax=Desulfobacter sp. TaxID=2294 RepID=UPI00257C9955|nr:hypothetical protein [Desulfobacter sp.]
MKDQNEGKLKKTWVAPAISVIQGLDSCVEFLYDKDGSTTGGDINGDGTPGFGQ